jgi:GR25 family glycosyltransferase involved in LPS biosynthesis
MASTLRRFKIFLAFGLIVFLKANLFCLQLDNCKNEGLFAHKAMDHDLVVISLFIPPAPSILLLDSTPEIYERGKQSWPLAQIQTSLEESRLRGTVIDFLWIHNGNYAETDFHPIKDLLKNTQALYKTSPSPSHAETEISCISELISNNSLSLCTKWYDNKTLVGAFFLKKAAYDGFINSINFNPQSQHLPIGHFWPSNIHRFLARIENKPAVLSIPQIDYIYMINLDERPEKFAASLSELQKYGISPCRFSAINGWTLPVCVLDELGVRLSRPHVRENVMGKVFREIEGVEYRNIEFIKEANLAYFCTGITRGAIGCIMSHLSVLQDAYDSNYETVWVLEDDIQMIEDPRQISSLISELDQIDPNWDIFFTDVDHKDSQGNYIPCRALAMRPDVPIETLSYYLSKFQRVNETFSMVGMRYGTHSMIFRRSGIKKLLDYYRQHALFLPYDCDYWLIPSLRMYSPNKDIVSITLNPLTDNGSPNYQK